MHSALARDHWCEEGALPIEEQGAAVAGSVFLIEPVSFVAASLSSALASLALEIEVFENGEEFFARVDPDRWGCLLVRLHSLGGEGIRILEELGRRGMAIPVILVDSDGAAMATVDLVGSEPGRVQTGVRKALAQRVRRSLDERSRRRQWQLTRAELRARLARLSDREREVAERVAAGQANKVIAFELGISERTVEAHRAHAMRKLAASSAAELVRIVLLSGDSELGASWD
jgi:FixJ family two-component response regulator